MSDEPGSVDLHVSRDRDYSAQEWAEMIAAAEDVLRLAGVK